MSYPEKLQNTKNIQELLFKKEFAELKLESNSRLLEHDEDYNESILEPLILKANKLTLHSHQLFVKNFFNPNTPYKRILFKHSTGSGKTIASLTIAMMFIKYYKLEYKLNSEDEFIETPSVFIIGFSKNIFQKELLRRPEFGFINRDEIIEHRRLKYLAETGSQIDINTFNDFENRLKKRLIKKSKGGFFKFIGYKEFFNRLFIFQEIIENNETLSDEQIINGLKNGTIKLNIELVNSFKNSIIICDEIHNVYNSSEINNYGIAIKMILNIYDAPEIMSDIIKDIKIYQNSILRVIFMSATPINNSPTEIIDLLNLLIPLNELPEKRILKKDDFFMDNRNLKDGSLEKIKKMITGYISFLRDDNPKYFPEKKMDGEQILIPNKLLKERVNFYKGDTIPYLKFIRCPMSSYHQKTYDKIYTGTLPPDGQTLIDLVLPNPGLIEEKDIGLFKTKDIKYSLINSSQEWKDKYQINIEKSSKSYIITGEFMKYENLKKYSTKYVKMLEYLFKNLQNDKGKVIISHQYVKMSGVLFIQEVLRKNGFIDQNANSTDETLCSKCGIQFQSHKKENHDFIPARFIVYHGEIDKYTLDSSLEKFKSSDNKDGYLYRILIGSKIINEGIDFNAVRNIYVMICPTNIPTLIQILGRAIRKNSHINLPPEKRNVSIKIFTSSTNLEDDLSYEENKYFEKSQDYLVIQQIEKIFNETAIDSVIHRDMIMPIKKQNFEPELGTLYFEPSEVFGKKLLDIANGKNFDKKDITLSTFRAFNSDSEIEMLIYIIKRLFIEQSSIWKYNDLWKMVKSPPFDVFVNTNMFLEENFIIALYTLADQSIDIYKILNIQKNDIDFLFNHLDKRIKKPYSDIEYKIIYHSEYYILFPIVNNPYIEESDNSLGASATNLTGYPDIDIDTWHRTYDSDKINKVKITKFLKTSKISYIQMKYKFYNQYKDYKIEELPISTEVYDIDFHSKLIEDCIRYIFNILTNADFKFSELHEFYFKMLYFYDKLDLIIFANIIENNDILEKYKPFITHGKIKLKKEEIKEDHGYNAFLMSSIGKSSEPINFNIKRINDFIGKPSILNNVATIRDMDFEVKIKNRTIRKVFDSILPVGHFLNTVDETGYIIAVPKLYIPETDNWEKSTGIIKPEENIIENDIIIGYYEKNPNGIDTKFKMRMPLQKIKMHEDTRMIERGIVCASRKKDELKDIIKKLDIDTDENSIKSLCETIKLELMKRELKERRKAKHLLPENKHIRTKWFYLSYEQQFMPSNIPS